MSDRRWDVFIGTRRHPVTVYARSAAEAKDTALRESSVKPGEKAWPHRYDCVCDLVEVSCIKAALERRLKGTPLGKVCRLG